MSGAKNDDSGSGSKTPPNQPKTARSYEDRVAFRQAFADVRPLKGSDRIAKPKPGPAPPRDEAADEAARQRLDALVGGGIRFKIEHEGGHGGEYLTTGLRVGTHPSFLAELDDRELRPDAECDLHGMTGEQAHRAVTRFVREQARLGARIVLVIHGKGRHSGGRGVLLDHAIDALTKGAGPHVAAFRTARRTLGGAGALAVRIKSR